MADNTTLSGGDVIRDKDRAGVKTQIVALDLTPGSAETLTTGTVPVSAGSLPLPTGASTEATLASALAALAHLTDGTQLTKGTALTSATLANVSSSASTTTLQASNANRRSWSCFNDSTAVLYIKFGATASTTSYTVQVPAGGYYEMPLPVYTGVIDGIWASANGAARVTEGA